MDSDHHTGELPIMSPANMLPVQVLLRKVIAPDVVTLYLVLPNTEQAPAPYLPGQFVTLAIPTPTKTLYRSYSLCGDGAADQSWEISVKRIQRGTVSNYLYEHVSAGTLLYSSLPRGTFTLPAYLQPGTPIIFVAAGSGITPIMGMLSALALLPPDRRPQVQLHYAARTPMEVIYRRELQGLDPRERWLRQWYYISSHGNRLSPEGVIKRVGPLTASAHWYMCGPEALKRDLQALLEEHGVPDEQIHAEVFVPQEARPQERETARTSPVISKGDRYLLRIEETGGVLEIGANETLLEALERQGYRPEWSCRAGACGACKLRVLSGQVEPVGGALTARERQAGYVLGCVAKPLGDVILASGGRPPANVTTGGVVPAPGEAAAARRTAVRRVRVAAVLAVGGLLLGTWNLTNHMPASLASNTAPAPTVTAPATPAQNSTPTAAPTLGTLNPTPVPSVKPKPTSPPTTNPPTATPKPKPPTPTPTTQSGTSHPY